MNLTFSAIASVPFNSLVPLKNIFIPSTITSLEDSQLYINGWLPNTCHKSPIITHSINEYNEIRITVETTSYDISNPYCPPQVTLFNKKINLGKLKSGKYLLIINEGTIYEENEALTIHDIQVELEPLELATITDIRRVERSRNILSIQGYHLYCQDIKDLKLVRDKNKNVFNIIPVVTTSGDLCPNKRKFFSYELDFPLLTTPGEKLIHVKSKGLKSLNYIFHIR